MLNINDYITQLQDEQAKANKANQDRLNEVKGLYDEIIASYAPGGSFGAEVESQLKTSKTKATSSGAQALARSGFANSTMMAQLGNTFEKEVGAPTRLTLESQRQAGINAAKQAKAGVIENVQDTGPDDSLIAQLLSQSSSTGGTITMTAPSKLKLDSSGTSSKDTSYEDRMAAWRSGGMTGSNKTTLSSSAQPVSSASMTDDEFQTLLNQNLSKSKRKATINFSYWPEG